MAVHSLSTTSLPSGQRFYVDTSAVLVLAHAEASTLGKPVPSRELARARQLQPFLSQVRGASGHLRTSVLVFEEIAAKVRNDFRREEAKAAGYSDWPSFKRADTTSAGAADIRAQVSMLAFLAYAASGAGREQIAVERCAVEKSATLVAGEKVRKYHRKLLKEHVKLDSMDALHIVVGLEMNIRNFVTFDYGWGTVGAIEVYQG